jgi:hypothetical protein
MSQFVSSQENSHKLSQSHILRYIYLRVLIYLIFNYHAGHFPVVHSVDLRLQASSD